MSDTQSVTAAWRSNMENRNQIVAALETKLEKLQMKRSRMDAYESKLKARRNKARYGMNWVEDLAIPLGKSLLPLTGLRGVTKAGPFGLGSRLSIYLTPEEGQDFHPTVAGTIEFTIEPRNVFLRDDGPMLAMVDYSERHTRYLPGTIGELNGFNYRTRPIPDDITPEELLVMIRECNPVEELETA